MSATWIQALRAYMARRGPPSTLASRRRLYDHVAQTHLAVHRGERLRADSLAVLREARWALLRDGTTSEKAALLEHILRSLSLASESVTYEGSAAPSSDRRSRRGNSASSSHSMQCAQQGTPSSPTAAASSDSSPLHNLKESHQLLLEQVQCLVEAKVSEIPLTARHYRYPLRSPLLAEVSPELPLLLLDEISRQPHADAQQQKATAADTPTPDWAAQVECGASLAGAGHIREALALCSDDGLMFRTVLQRVAWQRRDGWRRAWALAEAVPMERVICVAAPGSPASSSTRYSEDWLRGVLEAVQLRARATPPQRAQARSSGEAEQDKGNGGAAPADDSEQLFVWVGQLRKLILSASAMAGAGQVETRQRHALRKAQRLVMDAYLSVCPPSRWREAVGVVLEMKAALLRASSCAEANVAEQYPKGRATDAQPEDNDRTHAHPVLRSDSDVDVVSAGRLLALLQFAQQPWMTLLFFYGNPLHLLAASAPSGQQQRGARETPSVWSVKKEEVRLVVENLVREAKETERLPVACGALFHHRDVHHAAVYNHAMAALAATGHTNEAMQFYATLPAACANTYTHWGVLHIFLQPNSPYTAAAALSSSTNYGHCHRALSRLAPTLPSAHAATDAAAPSSPSCLSTEEKEGSFTRDQANVWESMALWAALRRDTSTALLCATHAPGSCRYVHLIAMIAAANENRFHCMNTVLRQLCGSPRTTRKELCLAAAVVAVYYPLDHSGGGKAHQLTSATTPELVSAYDALACTLGKSVCGQQACMDEVVQLLIDDVVSLRRRRGAPVAPEDVQTALQDVLVKARILNSTMDLVRLGCPKGGATSTQRGGDAVDDGSATAVWRTVARLIQSVGSQQKVSVARAAPAFVSAGASAEVAIDLLPM
ncbi:hypothetical protein ABL78_7297 [Leptomonas seymouri]|uniref:Uncharacterized protein n=1 Tax=Leptomonas seymouri TaxID=5684 RepID=A0A0N1I264_LEPSE|nr:hypothetical protein ABL78_7297 [Leptomonas seymouri]|eukprot:KPI83658.1 hypothetical protein ABL78_7297 [Leptomonas seymouri]